MSTETDKSSHTPLPDPALDTLQSIAALHARGERSVSRPQRFVESAIAAVGRPRFLGLTLAFVILWIVADTLFSRFPGARHFDPPPYDFLQGIATVAALLLTIMILIAQNRQSLMAERRAQLDLQISLLVDQKNAKIIGLLEELRRDMPQVRDRHDPEAEAMQSTADPEAMLVALDFLMTEAAAGRVDADAPTTREEAESLREEIDEINESLEEMRAVTHSNP